MHLHVRLYKQRHSQVITAWICSIRLHISMITAELQIFIQSNQYMAISQDWCMCNCIIYLKVSGESFPNIYSLIEKNETTSYLGFVSYLSLKPSLKNMYIEAWLLFAHYWRFTHHPFGCVIYWSVCMFSTVLNLYSESA